MDAGTSPISSRKTVPVSACSNLPGLEVMAPVEAPFSKRNSGRSSAFCRPRRAWCALAASIFVRMHLCGRSFKCPNEQSGQAEPGLGQTWPILIELGLNRAYTGVVPPGERRSKRRLMANARQDGLPFPVTQHDQAIGLSTLAARGRGRAALSEERTGRLWFACALAAIAIAPLQAQTATETVLHNFARPPKGANPYAGVIRDSAGNLYGTTTSGGSAGAGVVYKLDAAGRETVLYSFAGGTDGRYPTAGVIRSEEHTSELQSPMHRACRLLLEQNPGGPGTAHAIAAEAQLPHIHAEAPDR